MAEGEVKHAACTDVQVGVFGQDLVGVLLVKHCRFGRVVPVSEG